MDAKYAAEYLDVLRTIDASKNNKITWLFPLHIATNLFRHSAMRQLTRDPDVDLIALLEIYLEKPQNVDNFHGVHAVDAVGIWYYDGDGHIDDPIYRQTLIPWHSIRSIIIHAAS